MPVPHIRFATFEDEDALGRLDRTAWSPLYAVMPRPTPPYAPFFNERVGPRDHLIAEIDGAVVGYVRLVLATSMPCNSHVRQIQGLVVSDETRGSGVGRALLRAVQDEARRQGARRITLRVLGHNAPARKLYESEGFAVEGILPEEFLLDGGYVDDVLMGRSL